MMTRYTFAELVDIEKLQELMDRFHTATGIPVGIIDVEEKILVATGWQEICCKFHRVHPETLVRCRQSDAFIQGNLHTGGYIEYKCRNGLWDLALPLLIDGVHMATLFLGQFFYEGEDPNLELFRSQAREFGFDEESYLRSLASVPSFSREKVKHVMDYYTNFVQFLMETGHTNLKRIEMEKALLNNKEQLEQFFKTSPDNILITRFDSDEIFDLNDNFIATLGYSRNELLGKTTRDMKLWASEEDRERYRRLMVESGQCRDFAAFFRSKTGIAIPMRISAQCITRLNETFTISNCRDITAKVKAEREADFFRSLIESTRDPVYVLSHKENYRMVYVNQAACSHFGMEREQLLSMRIPDWDPLFDEEKVDLITQEVKQKKSIRFETVHRVFSGKLVPVEVTANYLIHNGEELTVGSIYNISERKQTEESVRESEARFRMLFHENQALLNGIPDGLTLLSPDLRILWANSVSAKMTGTDSTEMIGRYCYEFRHGQNAPCDKCPVKTTFATGEKNLVTTQHQGKTIELRSVPVKDENGKVIKVIEIGRDITEQENLQHQLQHSQKMEAVGQLAGGVAHDFNNILTAIIGFSSLMQMKMEEGHHLRHYAEQIVSAADKAAGLTQSLLAFSKKQIIDPHPLELNEAIVNVHKLLRRLLREDVELVTNLWPEPITVMADRINFEQVLMNLVTNGRDAMPNGGTIFIGTEKVPIDEEFVSLHGYGKPGSYACISITDTGAGMDQMTREKVFDPFFTTKEPGTGTGLGLATVYGIIKQHEGYINVYSEPGFGTTFKIYLPNIVQLEPVEAKSASPYPKGGIETILLVDDSEYVRESNRELLENFGYRVIEAVDGEDAINTFVMNQDKIDLIILDVIMPKKSGKDVYETAKKTRADIKVLFTSGYTAEVITQKVILDQQLHFIAKPIVPRELLKKIRAVLGQ